jgi:hypothetical protein
MSYVQLEFKLKENIPDHLRFEHMQIQLDEMKSSMGKVRRKLFSEMDEMKKLYVELLHENERLRAILRQESEACKFQS